MNIRITYHILLFIISFIFTGEEIYYKLNLFSINRLSDGGVIKIPFRLASIDLNHSNDNLDVNSTVSIEYKPKFSDFYLRQENSTEFLFDLRELYVKWYFDNSDLSIGKQIHSWGAVDQNSPIDNASPYDYYYILLEGSDQKIGSFSLSYSHYFNNSVFGFAFSPIHHTNRLPLGKDDFPIELPVIPNPVLVNNVEDEVEFGAYLKQNFDKFDLTLSYYNGNDRIYNLSGVNVFTNEQQNVYANIDTVFSFRKTEVLGLGGTYIDKNFALRFDYGLFHTFDNSSNVERMRFDMLNGTALDQLWYQVGASHAFEEDVHYQQTTVQFERFNSNSSLILSYFEYKINKYTANYLAAVDIPGVEADVNPRDYFYPGLGAPLAILAPRAFLYQIQKNIDNKILSFKGLKDLNESGLLLEISLESNINDNLLLKACINKIWGDENMNGDYRFNQMEDFSHLRFEMEYLF